MQKTSELLLEIKIHFGNGREGEKLSLVKSKKFWHFQNEIELPKHRLEIQKFRSLEDSSVCSKLLFDNTFFNRMFQVLTYGHLWRVFLENWKGKQCSSYGLTSCEWKIFYKWFSKQQIPAQPVGHNRAKAFVNTHSTNFVATLNIKYLVEMGWFGVTYSNKF